MKKEKELDEILYYLSSLDLPNFDLENSFDYSKLLYERIGYEKLKKLLDSIPKFCRPKDELTVKIYNGCSYSKILKSSYYIILNLGDSSFIDDIISIINKHKNTYIDYILEGLEVISSNIKDPNIMKKIINIGMKYDNSYVMAYTYKKLGEISKELLFKFSGDDTLKYFEKIVDSLYKVEENELEEYIYKISKNIEKRKKKFIKEINKNYCIKI